MNKTIKKQIGIPCAIAFFVLAIIYFLLEPLYVDRMIANDWYICLFMVGECLLVITAVLFLLLCINNLLFYKIASIYISIGILIIIMLIIGTALGVSYLIILKQFDLA